MLYAQVTPIKETQIQSSQTSTRLKLPKNATFTKLKMVFIPPKHYGLTVTFFFSRHGLVMIYIQNLSQKAIQKALETGSPPTASKMD